MSLAVLAWRLKGWSASGVRFGQAVGTEPVPAQELRQPVSLLLGRAEGKGRIAGEAVDAHADRDRCPPAGDLLEHLQADLVGLTAAARLYGIGEGEQPGPAEQLHHLTGKSRMLLVPGGPRGQFPVAQLSRHGQQVALLILSK